MYGTVWYGTAWAVWCDAVRGFAVRGVVFGCLIYWVRALSSVFVNKIILMYNGKKIKYGRIP